MLRRLGFPDIGRHRGLVTAIGIDALGSGVWMPLSVLYFTVVTDVRLAHIGLALSIAATISVPFALVVGQLVDRIGAKRVLQTGNVLQAAGFAAYPLAHSWWGVMVVVAIQALGRTAFFGSYSALVAAVSEPGERESWFGVLGALRNSGFAVGGLLAAGAISAGTTEVFHAVVLLNAATYVASFIFLVPVRVPQREGQREGGTHPRSRLAELGGFREVVRDRGYRWLIGANAGYAMGCVALTLVMPVYVVRVLGLPGWISGAVYVINTVMIGLGQGLVVRRMAGSLRWRIVVLAAGFMAVGFALLYAASLLTVTEAVPVVLLAAVVYSLGEMVGGPVLSALAAEAPPENLRGRYLATFQLSWNGAAALAPVLYLWLLDIGTNALWPALILLVALGAACCWPLRAAMPLADRAVTNAVVP